MAIVTFQFTPDRVPVGLCTHIFYAFAALNVASFEARYKYLFY